MKFGLFSLIVGAITLAPQKVFAHCPLCTAGAGAIAAAAMSLGVKVEVVGILIGAFAAALGFYIANQIKKKYFPGQYWVIVLATFALTVIPLMPLMSVEPYAIVVYWFGEAGSLFNRVYLANRFVVSAVFGGALMALAPKLSQIITDKRDGKRFPYQTLVVTLAILVLTALIVQFGL